mmetsp:Transcript_10825/g.40111  ORF Transcript_10825/g.40111 Transcript_10825/m.40111 type:complete len:273 (+) Transcript_10825:1315-2133(+)
MRARALSVTGRNIFPPFPTGPGRPRNFSGVVTRQRWAGTSASSPRLRNPRRRHPVSAPRWRFREGGGESARALFPRCCRVSNPTTKRPCRSRRRCLNLPAISMTSSQTGHRLYSARTSRSARPGRSKETNDLRQENHHRENRRRNHRTPTRTRRACARKPCPESASRESLPSAAAANAAPRRYLISTQEGEGHREGEVRHGGRRSRAGAEEEGRTPWGRRPVEEEAVVSSRRSVEAAAAGVLAKRRSVEVVVVVSTCPSVEAAAEAKRLLFF